MRMSSSSQKEEYQGEHGDDYIDSALSGLSVDSDKVVGYEAAGASSMDEVHDKAIIESLLPESEELCSMEKPIPFVVTNVINGKLELNPMAVEILNKVKQPVCVISIVGKYRTGKSYIMNRFFNVNEGFTLGSSSEAKTKGIWMWLKPHPTIDNQYLLLLDTEGMYDAKKIDSIQDQNMFCLCLLLSSCLVYNVFGVLDTHVMEQLHFVTELTKHIKVKEYVDEDGASFSKYFPDFCFLLRDFFLDLQSDGQSVDSNGYMEGILKFKEGNDENTDLYNEPRVCIKNYFPHRRCYTLGKPVEDDNQLKNLEQLKNEDLKQLFLEKSKSIVEDILNNTKPLCVKEHQINCSQLTDLAGFYIKCINESSAPCISSAVERLRVIESTRALERSTSLFVNKMDGLFDAHNPTPLKQDALQKYRDQFSSMAISAYRKMPFYDKAASYESKLLENIETKYREIKDRNNTISRELCTKLISECFVNMDQRMKQNNYLTPGGYEKYKNDKKDAVKKYKDSPNKGSMAENVLVEYMEKRRSEEEIVLNADQALAENRKILYQEALQRKQLEEKTLLVETQNMNYFKELERQQEEHRQMILGLQEENTRRHKQSVKEFQESLQQKQEKSRQLFAKGLEEQSKHYKLQIEEMKAKNNKSEEEHKAQMLKLQEEGNKYEEKIQQLKLQQSSSQKQIEKAEREISKLKYEQVYKDGINQYRDATKDYISLKQYIVEEQKAWSYFIRYTEGYVKQHRAKWQRDIIDITMIERKDVTLLLQAKVDSQHVIVSFEQDVQEDKDHFLAKEFQRVFQNEKFYVSAILQYKTGIPYNKSLKEYIEREKGAWETYTSNADGDKKCYIERWQEEVVNIVKERKEVYLLIENYDSNFYLENLFQNHRNHYLVREFQAIYENQRLMDNALEQYGIYTSRSRTLTEYILHEEKAWRQFASSAQVNNKRWYKERWQERITDITTTHRTDVHSLISKEFAENNRSFEDMTDRRINHYLIVEFKHIYDNVIHFENSVKEYGNRITNTTSIDDYYRHENSAWRSFKSKAKGLTELYQDKWQKDIVSTTIKNKGEDITSHIRGQITRFKKTYGAHVQDEHLFDKEKQHFLTQEFVQIYRKEIEEMMKNTKLKALQKSALAQQHGNLAKMFEYISKTTRNDITGLDVVISEYTKLKPKRENTTRSLQEIQEKVKSRNNKSWWVNGGSIVVGVGGTALAFLVPPVGIGIATVAAAVGGINTGNKLYFFNKDKAEEISKIIRAENNQTKAFFKAFHSKFGTMDFGITGQDLEKVIEELSRMIAKDTPKADLLEYLRKVEKDMKDDSELLDVICVYLVLHKMYLSLHRN